MRILSLNLAILLTVATAAGCTTTTNNTTTTTNGPGTGTGNGNGTGAGTTGDNTKNTGSISAKGKDGSTTEVKGSGSTGSGSTSGSSKNGAMVTDKLLTIYLSDASGTVSIVIDTAKYPLPMSGIKAGSLGDGALVTYTGTAGAFSSDGSGGTIDITACPVNAANSVAVGVLHNVVCNGVSATGQSSYTLDGAFNAVIDGGFGSIQCTPPAASTGGGADATTGGGGGGGTCSFTPCSDPTAHCCPFMGCMDKCTFDCFNAASSCSQKCVMDPGGDAAACFAKCDSTAADCDNACTKSCNVSAGCLAVIGPVNACRSKAMAGACKDKKDAAADQCQLDQCCAEAKAAF